MITKRKLEYVFKGSIEYNPILQEEVITPEHYTFYPEEEEIKLALADLFVEDVNFASETEKANAKQCFLKFMKTYDLLDLYFHEFEETLRDHFEEQAYKEFRDATTV